MNTAMLLEKNLFTLSRNLSPFQQFFGKGKKSILSSMQKFGEMCVTTNWDNSHCAKLANHGTPGIWVGYADSTPLVNTRYSIPRLKRLFNLRCDFSTEVICGLQ